MARVTPEDVQAAFLAAWSGNAALAAAVPGGLWHGWASAPAAMPYAVLQVTEQDPDLTTGNAYTKRFSVVIEVRAEAGTVAAGAPAATEPIRALVESLPGPGDTGSALAVANGRVVSAVPRAGRSEVDPQRKDAQAVLVTAAAWDLVVQGSRA